MYSVLFGLLKKDALANGEVEEMSDIDVTNREMNSLMLPSAPLLSWQFPPPSYSPPSFLLLECDVLMGKLLLIVGYLYVSTK